MRILLLSTVILMSVQLCNAQDDKGVKNYPAGIMAGEVKLISSHFVTDGTVSKKIFVIEAPRTAMYELKTVAAGMERSPAGIQLDNRTTGITLYTEAAGWQKIVAGRNGHSEKLLLTAGKHEITFIQKGDLIPMVDDICLQSVPGLTSFDTKWDEVKKVLDAAAAKPVISGNEMSKVEQLNSLANPEGDYDHEVNTAFAYTTFAWVSLAAGTNVTFATEGSTTDPVMYLFLPSNMQLYSWADDDGGPGVESQLTVSVPVTGVYALVVRSFYSTTGTTNIIKDGAAYINSTQIGGVRFNHSVKTGPLNYFTCQATGDTRLFVANSGTAPFRGYDDDYTTTGDWDWNYCSRIKKNFSDNISNTILCAYSMLSTGSCDVYMGNQNSDVYAPNYSVFPSLKQDDAIRTAPSTGQYNCISWSGGVTTDFIWPPSWASTYNCNGSAASITCFDNFYLNSPARYPGAWTYSRSGATSSNNQVDLWKLDTYFTHASVRKPGNDHPHGYDWESKPGTLTRTLHPRYALTNDNTGYGSVSNYYKFTGSYASRGASEGGFATDADAVNAGLAVFEDAKLSAAAQQKLNKLVTAVDGDKTNRFDQLYAAWKKTWTSIAMYSDPDMYCRNEEYKALETYCLSNYTLIYKIFERFTQGDHFIGNLLWEMTRAKYSKLLAEVKDELIRNPNDEQGRFRIHGDHDNGVWYVEKILSTIEDKADLVSMTDRIAVTVSPNPVKDIVTVQVTLPADTKIRIELISLLTGKSLLMQSSKQFAAGLNRFSANISGMGLNGGDILAVKVTTNEEVRTVKAMIMK